MYLSPEDQKILNDLIDETVEKPKSASNRQPKKTPRRFRKRLNDDELAKVLKDLHR